MDTIAHNSYVQRNASNLIISEFDNDLVMMDMENGSYLSLNKTGRIIWEQLEQPIVVGDLIQQLVKRFSVDEKTCTDETLDFLDNMKKLKALLIY